SSRESREFEGSCARTFRTTRATDTNQARKRAVYTAPFSSRQRFQAPANLMRPLQFSLAFRGDAASILGSFALLCSLAAIVPASAATVDLPRYPALSPDGREVCFSWRGDIWKAPSTGGAAVRLTSHPADDLRMAWSTDGSLIAFESERDGYRNLFV